MISHVTNALVAALATVLVAVPGLAQDSDAGDVNRDWTIPEIIELSALTIAPQILTDTGGEGTTVGVKYEYDRPLDFVPDELAGFEIEGSLRSEGLFAAKESRSPERRLQHNFELTGKMKTPSGRFTNTSSRTAAGTQPMG